MADPLATYKRKRDFAKTDEPAGAVVERDCRDFMVQKHDATRLHYDLRLELDGVLKSWAVTRGPSLDPADKRLAVRTEDHPLSYATFEGTIPRGQYGGGTVMLWDRGSWTPVPGKNPRKSLENGHLHFTLDGERMKGEWILIRLRKRGNEKNENWILRKIEDQYAGAPAGLTEKYLTSIKTGRNMQEIAAGKKTKELASWTGSQADGPRKTSATRASPKAKGGSKASPAFQPPQLATLVDHIPSGSAWIHEMKYDGYRCLLSIGGGGARIFTRSGLDWTDRFPDIAAEASRLETGSALLDGEIVSLDDQGSTSFSELQRKISEGGRGLSLFLFDALEIDGEDLTPFSNLERKQRLASLLGEGRPPLLLYAEHIVGQGEKLFDAMCAAGQEGIISKKADAPYRGTRTKAWLKIKCIQRQEFVIVGWTPSESKARALRSLLLAVNEGGSLRYTGKVGTGFSMPVLRDLAARLARIERKSAPLGVPQAEARGARWVTPKLVAEVAFAEFTSEGVVRHASFIGLREDKPAAKVVAEKPRALPVSAHDGIKITNPERIIDPDSGVSKGDLVEYYRNIGALMNVWSAERPLSLVRCPQGRARKCFFQKHNTGSFGPHVHQIAITEKKGAREDYVYVKDVAGLIACVQMGTIEFHGWGSKVADVEAPDRLVLDLDPDEELGFEEVKKAARDLKRHLADMGLQTFPLLTGGKGLHVVAPLAPEAEWPRVKDFAQRFCIALATAEPERFTANLAKAARKGRIFLDYLRNQRGATAIMPYSARARPGTPVSAPISWDELDETQSGARFTIRDSALLLDQASSRSLQGWGEAAQSLPDL